MRSTWARNKPHLTISIMDTNLETGINPPNGNNPQHQFCGTYTAQSSQYFQNNTTNFLVKVCERKNPNALKPTKYLMARSEDGKFKYLTSLYPRNGVNIAEMGGKFFVVEFPFNGNMVVTAK
jgi:hypothetical protein